MPFGDFYCHTTIFSCQWAPPIPITQHENERSHNLWAESQWMINYQWPFIRLLVKWTPVFFMSLLHWEIVSFKENPDFSVNLLDWARLLLYLRTSDSPRLFLLFFLLKYTWCTIFLQYSKMIQLYSYAHSFLYFFSCGLSQDIKYSSLCYMVGPCCLAFLYVIACFY